MSDGHDPTAPTMVVIPARWASKRLPGKPLLPINGIALLDRVIRLARSAIDDETMILVATDDYRIADHCRNLGQEWVMSDPAIASGSERVWAAVKTLPVRPDYVVNLQGDAPFLPDNAIAQVIGALRAGHAVATPVVRLDWAALDALRDQKRRSPFSGTTCIRTSSGQARWFSKQIIPAIRNEEEYRRRQPISPVFRHLGLYGYSFEALELFQAAQPSAYECFEQLEQLRLFDLDIPIHTIVVDAPSISMSGIDTAEDVRLAEDLIARHGDPFYR